MSNVSEKIVVIAEQDMAITEVVALQSRPTPPVKSTALANAIWADEGMAALHIKSVYDFSNNSTDGSSFDGCFLSECSDAANITSVNDLANPAKATADQRPARFVRLLKAVSLPDRNDPDCLLRRSGNRQHRPRPG